MSRSSVCVSVVDVEIVELAGRAIAFELFRFGVCACLLKKLCQERDMLGAHLFFDAIGTKGFDGAAHEEPRLIERVS